MQPELQRAVFAGTVGDAAIAALCAMRSQDGVGPGIDAMLAAHAFGALDDSEARAVEAALVWDAAARRAFHEHLAGVAALALTGEPIAPPPRVRARLLASLDAMTQ